MTKQEYQEKLLCIKADNVGFRLLEGIKIRNQYIDSLEADVEQLKAENAQLMSQVEVIGKALDLACEFISKNGITDSSISIPWKEYFIQQANGGQDV